MSNGNGKAPICPTSRSEWPAVSFPAQHTIVPATDLPSAIAALNQINAIVQQQLVPPGPNSTGALPAQPVKPSPIIGIKAPPPWEEVERAYDQTNFYNPDDNNVAVTLVRITHLRFHNHITKESLEWDL